MTISPKTSLHPPIESNADGGLDSSFSQPYLNLAPNERPLRIQFGVAQVAEKRPEIFGEILWEFEVSEKVETLGRVDVA